MRRSTWMWMLLGLALSSGQTLAHHGSSATWDPSKTVTVTGTVHEFSFINPHVLISIEVPNGAGKVDRWSGELTNPISLARSVGWTRVTFKPGDVITLAGYPARNGATQMAVTRVLSSDRTQRYPSEEGAGR